MTPEGWRPDWDLIGVVERQAEDGSGPALGERVVGAMPEGAWARYVPVANDFLGSLPDSLSFAQAATLPTAGLTALHALSEGGLLLGGSVPVTGATGGVGNFALQLAHAAGMARIVAHIRHEDQAQAVRESGATVVLVGSDFGVVDSASRFELIIDGVGGEVLGRALGLLVPGGTCVSYGLSAGDQISFDGRSFFQPGRTQLYGLTLSEELRTAEGAAAGLTKLAGLASRGLLKPQVSVQESWRSVASVASVLMNRTFTGKAVWTLD